MTRRATLLMILTVAAGCGGPEDDTAETAPLCSTDTTGGAPVAKMAGNWTGTGEFQQTWNGKTAGVPVNVNLTFDEQGVPATLPALGMVSPWQTYPHGAPSLRDTLESGGTAFAYCTFEADGSANLIDVHARSRCGTDSAIEWRYRAAYKFADLLHYELYDYEREGAPQVEVEAVDSFMLAKDRTGREVLTVRGRATGTTKTGQPVELRFDAQLERGQATYEYRCELGPHPAP